MSRQKFFGIKIGATVFLAALILFVVFNLFSENSNEVTLGLSPYQDTIIPIVPQELGWYQKADMDVDIKILSWGEVMTAVAAGAVDVAVCNFSSFQAAYPNISRGGAEVVFWHPTYMYLGAAIMVRGDATFQTMEEMIPRYDMEKALTATIKQLKGKTVITTKGTEMEQIVLTALKRANLKIPDDVKIIHAEPDLGLQAFLRGEADAYSGGLTERIRAEKEGCRSLINSSHLQPAVIDGFVTTRKFAKEREEFLLKLLDLWYQTIRYLNEDLDNRSQIVINYLNKIASTQYTVEEYKYTWKNTQIYPNNASEAQSLWFDKSSRFYWRKRWESNNQYLLLENKISEAIPDNVFWGEKIFEKYIERFDDQ